MLILNPPAKINWFLNVFGKREDGYHDILSLMQFVSLNDLLTIEDSDTIEVITEARIPPDNNLVYRASTLLRESAGVKAGARINLKKEVPVSAGLGGGSSDAAYTLIGLNQFWKLGLAMQELITLGERLGSDVPFFFKGPAALVEGRGEIVSTLKLNRPYIILLVKPHIDVSTSWAYSELNNARLSAQTEAAFNSHESEVLTKKSNNIKLLCLALENGDFSYLSSMLRNDLEPYVARRYPVISDIKNSLLAKGAVFSSMSGSGPTVFGVFDSEQKASDAIKDMPPNWCRVVKTVTDVLSS